MKKTLIAAVLAAACASAAFAGGDVGTAGAPEAGARLGVVEAMSSQLDLMFLQKGGAPGVGGMADVLRHQVDLADKVGGSFAEDSAAGASLITAYVTDLRSKEAIRTSLRQRAQRGDAKADEVRRRLISLGFRYGMSSDPNKERFKKTLGFLAARRPVLSEKASLDALFDGVQAGQAADQEASGAERSMAPVLPKSGPSRRPGDAAKAEPPASTAPLLAEPDRQGFLDRMGQLRKKASQAWSRHAWWFLLQGVAVGGASGAIVGAADGDALTGIVLGLSAGLFLTGFVPNAVLLSGAILIWAAKQGGRAAGALSMLRGIRWKRRP